MATAIACAQSACDQFWTPEYSQYACPEGYVITDCNVQVPPSPDPSCGGPGYYLSQIYVSCCATTTTPPRCPPDSECTAFVEAKLEYCEFVDGEWILFGGGVCACGNGLTEEIIYEGPAEFTPNNIKILRCIGEAPADYATCCSPEANPLDGNCQAYEDLLPSVINLIWQNGGAYCKSNPLP
jgi:hypothetical protein